MVAFTRCLLQALAIDDGEAAAPIADQALALQQVCDPHHTRAMHSQHLAHGLLREGKLRRSDLVARHQQPSCEPLLNGVDGVASYRLENLRQKRIGIARKQLAHRRRALLGYLDPSRLDAKCSSCDLGNRPGECGLVAAADDPANGAFAPDGRGFCCPAVFEHDDECRHHSRQWEVGDDDIILRLEQDLTAIEVNKLRVRFEQSAIAGRKGSKKSIVRPMASDVLISHLPPTSVRSAMLPV